MSGLKIAIRDERLPLEEALTNQSEIIPFFVDQLFALNDIYSEIPTLENDIPDLPPVNNQTENLKLAADQSIEAYVYDANADTARKYQEVLINVSTEAANQEDWKTLGFPEPDVYWWYYDATLNATIQTFYHVYGPYMGLGMNTACSEYINEVLSDKDEWAKMSSSAATTMMALLPTFLAFGHL